MTADLARLAALHGVATEYQDQAGRHRVVSEDTIVAVLAALGVAAGTPHEVSTALEQARLAPWRRVLPPVYVLREDRSGRCEVRVPAGLAVHLTIEFEGGAPGPTPPQLPHYAAPVDVEDRAVAEVLFELPSGLPTGWHTLRAHVSDGSVAACPLVVTPARLAEPPARGWGLALQLYATRSARSWGIGDLADLADLVRWSGFALGADFVQVNPLHAASPVAPMEPSPYLPVSRRFANPIYVRVEQVPEYAYLPPPSRDRVAQLAEGPLASDHSAELLDRDACWAAKRAALELVHAVPRPPGREAAYQAYRRREGRGLDDFATWCALVERYGPMEDWPEPLRDPRSERVAQERTALADRIEFHCWLQWLLDDQLAATHEAALGAGMRVGVVHDLAVGVHPYGADAWSLAPVLAGGVTVGAPPDMYNQRGQDWSQPPWLPGALAEAGFAPYRDMLRTILRHSGGIRVDHVLGLFRLWWIPQGMSPDQGTYVSYDHDALVGILALEAQRAGAIVVGEDLGTVEPWVQDYLGSRGILGTTILWFERRPDGSIPEPGHWRAEVLASVTTHDLPPTAAYLAGEHIALRDRLDLLATPVAVERENHEREQASWRDALTAQGLLVPDAGEADVVLALHRFVGRTPARLRALSLGDAVGDRRAQNQPGTHEQYPNWRIPLTDRAGRPVLLEELAADPRLRELGEALRGE